MIVNLPDGYLVSRIEFTSERHCCSESLDEYPTLHVEFLDGGGGYFYEARVKDGFGIDPDAGVGLATALKDICEMNDKVQKTWDRIKGLITETHPAPSPHPQPAASSSVVVVDDDDEDEDEDFDDEDDWEDDDDDFDDEDDWDDEDDLEDDWEEDDEDWEEDDEDDLDDDDSELEDSFYEQPRDINGYPLYTKAEEPVVPLVEDDFTEPIDSLWMQRQQEIQKTVYSGFFPSYEFQCVNFPGRIKIQETGTRNGQTLWRVRLWKSDYGLPCGDCQVQTRGELRAVCKEWNTGLELRVR